MSNCIMKEIVISYRKKVQECLRGFRIKITDILSGKVSTQ